MGIHKTKIMTIVFWQLAAYVVIERLVFMKSYIIHDQMIDRYLIIVYEFLHREKISGMSYS